MTGYRDRPAPTPPSIVAYKPYGARSRITIVFILLIIGLPTVGASVAGTRDIVIHCARTNASDGACTIATRWMFLVPTREVIPTKRIQGALSIGAKSTFDVQLLLRTANVNEPETLRISHWGTSKDNDEATEEAHAIERFVAGDDPDLFIHYATASPWKLLYALIFFPFVLLFASIFPREVAFAIDWDERRIDVVTKRWLLPDARTAAASLDQVSDVVVRKVPSAKGEAQWAIDLKLAGDERVQLALGDSNEVATRVSKELRALLKTEGDIDASAPAAS